MTRKLEKRPTLDWQLSEVMSSAGSVGEQPLLSEEDTLNMGPKSPERVPKIENLAELETLVAGYASDAAEDPADASQTADASQIADASKTAAAAAADDAEAPAGIAMKSMKAMKSGAASDPAGAIGKGKKAKAKAKDKAKAEH